MFVQRIVGKKVKKKTKFVQDILRELDDDWTEDDIVGIVCDVSTREKSVYRMGAERI